MEKVFQVANMYVACLRSLYLLEQNCHWLTKGASFYGDHLLFERLYQSAAADADLMAEKFIGVFGEEACGMQAQAEMIGKLMVKYKGEKCHAVALRFEKDILEFSQQMYDLFEKEEKMTLGLDDAIMSVASKREEATYLLQQALAEEELDALD